MIVTCYQSDVVEPKQHIFRYVYQFYYIIITREVSC